MTTRLGGSTTKFPTFKQDVAKAKRLILSSPKPRYRLATREESGILDLRGPKLQFVVIGPQGSGKSTFGDFLAEALGTKAISTSDWLVEVETKRQKVLKGRYGLSTVLWNGTFDMNGPVMAEYWDRERNRPVRELLVSLGDAVCETNPGFLVERCFDKGDVCVGVRRRVELDWVREHYPDAIVVYVARPGHEPESTDNFELNVDDADRTIINTATSTMKIYAEGIVEEMTE